MRLIITLICSIVIVWIIPITSKAIESKLRSAIISVGEAGSIDEVYIVITKVLVSFSLWIFLSSFSKSSD